jgi:glyoxylase-like metal-dependent hydrolase (beta-lactamase superfamily II)
MLIQNPPVQITDALWMLGLADYPVYFFRGESEWAIFEGGIGPAGPIVRGQLETLGVDKDSIRYIVITHAHPDHVMAVPLFRQAFPNAAVLASEAAAKTLAAEKAVALFCKLDDDLTNALIQEGLIAPDQRRDPLTQSVIAVDRTLKEGDAVAIDGVSIRVFETPGHSDCSLSFFEPASRTLIISDATGYYLPECDGWWPCYFSDYAAYLSSMQRLAGMNAEILCLSHKAAIRGVEQVRSYFERAIAAAEQYHRRILDELQTGRPAREIAEELGREIHERTRRLPLEFFQKNCGLLVKLSAKHVQQGEGDRP